jgi:cytochrome d ubiquinol oxidase subunit II
MNFDAMLPVIFMMLLGVAMLAYVALDGYDLGVGMLMPFAGEDEKDTMVASIGPFWDANETWLVLGVGLLLVAFPGAQGVVLGALYLPVALMLLGLILRGVAFDFRVKAHDDHRAIWNSVFSGGSALAAVAQGWMLGRYVTGLQESPGCYLFAAIIAVALPCAFILLGATWLILKTEGTLQTRAIGWARRAWPVFALGFVAIGVATPIASPTVRERWFGLPAFFALAPVVLTCVLALAAMRGLLNSHRIRGKLCWAPFVLILLVLVLEFFGLTFSIFPYIVVDRLTIWQAASSPAALKFVLAGASVSIPATAAYTILAYRVFRGKATGLSYA